MSELTEPGIDVEVIKPEKEAWGVVDLVNEIVYGKDEARLIRERRINPLRIIEEVNMDEKPKRDLPKMAGHAIGLTSALCVCLLLLGGTIWALRQIL